MKIINNVTGQTRIAAQPITKSSGTLLLCTNKTFAQIENETVTIQIERTGAENVYIATDVKLKDLILLSLFNQNNGLLKDVTGTYSTVAVIELGLEAGVILSNSDKLQIIFDNCDATKIYDLSVVEDFDNTLSHVKLEKKSISSEDSEKWLDVSSSKLAVFKIDANVKEIGVRSGSAEKRFTPHEFRFMMQEVVPTIDNGAAGLVVPENYMLVDVQEYDYIGIFKTTGSIIPFTLFRYDELTASVSTPVRLAASSLATKLASQSVATAAVNTSWLKR